MDTWWLSIEFWGTLFSDKPTWVYQKMDHHHFWQVCAAWVLLMSHEYCLPFSPPCAIQSDIGVSDCHGFPSGMTLPAAPPAALGYFWCELTRRYQDFKPQISCSVFKPCFGLTLSSWGGPHLPWGDVRRISAEDQRRPLLRWHPMFLRGAVGRTREVFRSHNGPGGSMDHSSNGQGESSHIPIEIIHVDIYIYNIPVERIVIFFIDDFTTSKTDVLGGSWGDLSGYNYAIPNPKTNRETAL